MAVATPTPSQPVSQPTALPSLTVEEEDHIILARITNDERPLRRLIKKFHNYTALAHTPTLPPVASTPEDSVEDARDAFLVELASFQLTLKKSVMICEAEARQVEEYQRERQRIEDEHGTLRGQIEQLKTSLEHAQMLRRRKIEYDLVAEKVNTLPSREELEQSILALDNDMAAIRAEHETQERVMLSQKSALDGIVSDLGFLRFMGKDGEAVSVVTSPRDTPAPDILPMDPEVNAGLEASATLETITTEQTEDVEEGEEQASSVNLPSVPTSTTIEDDIEMGEVEENPKNKAKKKLREELEEGEASDTSSALSDPPDD